MFMELFQFRSEVSGRTCLWNYSSSEVRLVDGHVHGTIPVQK